MTRQQRLVLVASILTASVAFLDMTVVNVALPAMRADRGGGLAAQQWTVDAYLLTLGSLLPAAGSLSDLFGRKRVLALGLAGFGAASLLCAIAPSLWFLVAARALQGAAGALLVPSSLALIVATFQDAAQKRAIATWTAWSGIATVAGPLAGGVLVDAASWRWVFAMNLPLVAVTLLVVTTLEHDRRPDVSRNVNVTGAGLCAVGVGGVMFALIEAPLRGFGDPAVAFSLGGGILTFVAFIAYERTRREPMIDLALFRRRNFAVGASVIDEQPGAGRTPDARAFLATAKRRALDTTVPPELGAEAELEPLLVRASVRSFHAALWATAVLLLAGGVISAVGITNAPRRR
jgi:MFS family permease